MIADGTLRARLEALTGVTWLVLGLGLAVGPAAWRTSPSYAEVRRLLPLRVWGIVFLVIGVAELVAAGDRFRRRRLIFFTGLAVAAAWVLAFVFAAVDAELVGVPALWLLLAGVQALLL